MPKFKKKTSSFHRPSKYFHELDRRDPNPCWEGYGKTLYDNATIYQDKRTFQVDIKDIDSKLSLYASEIKVQIKITQQAIFLIGEILCCAKKVCQEDNRGFQSWIEETFDFSYETAINFMNVYKQCFCYRNLAFAVPPSILYKVSSPSFPEELREYLFMSGVLENGNNERIKRIVQRFKEGGIEAVENDIEEIGRSHLIVTQTRYTFDLCEDAFRTLEALKDSIELRSGVDLRARIDYKTKLETQQLEASKINGRLHKVLVHCLQSLDKALATSKEEIEEFKLRLKE